MPRIILFLETARLQNRHGQRVAHDHHGGGAGGRGQVERARFLGHPHVQDDVAVARQGGSHRAGDADDFDREALQRRDQIEQLLRFARITERQNDIAIAHNAEVAVQGIHAVQENAWRAGAGRVAAIFWPTLPDLPMPTTTILPRCASASTMVLTAALKLPSSCCRTAFNADHSISNTCRAALDDP